MSAGAVPPRPDLPHGSGAVPPNPIGAPDDRKVVTAPVAAGLAGVLVVVTVVFLFVRDDVTAPSLSTSATVRPSPSVARDPDPPNLTFTRSEGRVPGFPAAWHELRADDGSFRIVVPPGTSIHDLPAAGGWEFQIAGGNGAAFHVYAYDIGMDLPRAEATRLAKDQVEEWGGRDDDASAPSRVKSAGRDPVDGWEIRAPHGKRVRTFRVFPVPPWIIGLYVSSPTGGRVARLASGFLDSFEALRPPEQRVLSW